jgi:hypothetical protein
VETPLTNLAGEAALSLELMVATLDAKKGVSESLLKLFREEQFTAAGGDCGVASLIDLNQEYLSLLIGGERRQRYLCLSVLPLVCPPPVSCDPYLSLFYSKRYDF